MTVRENVIKGLMVCFTRISCKGKGCPYESEYERSRLCQAHLRDDALALLKAQEAVRPVTGLWDRDIQLYKCGACGGEIGACGIEKYCSHCGRKVKWDG